MQLGSTTWNWERFAARAPLESILTELPAGAAAWELEGFLRTGRGELERVRARATELGLCFGGERALDFGCGVGRLSLPLLEHYGRVDAVDASAAMLARARELAQESGAGDRVRWVHHRGPDLERLEDGAYDLVFTLLTLQHLPPVHAARFLTELVRKLRPGGTLFAQVPAESHPDSIRLLARSTLKERLRALLPPALLERYRHLRTGRPRMDMFGLPREEVERLVAAAGARLVATDRFDDTGGLLPSYRYFATCDAGSQPAARGTG